MRYFFMSYAVSEEQSNFFGKAILWMLQKPERVADKDADNVKKKKEQTRLKAK
jgi:hypothetical protein